MHGADLQALDTLRIKLESKAASLNTVTSQVSGAVDTLDRLWEGPDSAAFRQLWRTTYRPALLRASDGLRDAAATVERNRNAQEQTSASALGGPGGPGGPHGPGGHGLGMGGGPPNGGGYTPTEQATDSLQTIQDTLGKGDDLAVTEGELNRIQAHLADLDDEELAYVLANLSDRELEVLFHNVHSSGFWSNDWSNEQRAEFYENLQRAGETGDIELWRRLGEFSPHINPDPSLGVPDSAREEGDQPKIDFWEGLTYETREGQSLWGDASDPVDYTHVRQGSIGDCYLISAMISLAKEDPGIIQDLITENPNGTYTVNFADGTSEIVTPDLVYTADGQPAFARSEGSDATWPAVIEKAYAQKFGGWGDDPGITGGQSSVAIEALTGRESSYIDSGDLSLEDMAERFDNGEILGLSTIDKPDDLTTSEWVALDDTPDMFKGDDKYQKLHQNHAFIVVGVDAEAGTVSVINPWNPSKPPLTMSFDEMQESVNGVRVNEAP